MPLLKHAIKKMHQDRTKTARNDLNRAKLKLSIKNLKKAVVAGKTQELPEMLKKAYSVIDTAFKKGLLKRNTAARRKSTVSRLVNTALLQPAK